MGGLTVDCNNRTHEGALQSEAPFSAQTWYASGAVFMQLGKAMRARGFQAGSTWCCRVCCCARTRRFPKKCARQIRISELRAEPERRYRVCPGTPRCLFTGTGTCNPVQVKSNQVKLRGEPGSGYVAGCRCQLYVSAIGLCAKCSPPVCSFFHHLNTTLSHPGRQAALEAAMRTSHIYV